MRRPRLLRFLSRFVLSVALLSQAALAATSCAWARMQPDTAVAGDMSGEKGCPGVMQHGAVCIAHCQQDTQAFNALDHIPPAAPPPSGILTVAAQPTRSPDLAYPVPAAIRGAPPLTVLHCSWQK